MQTAVDVLIVGAGISGIGAAYYLQRDLPGKSYAILEGRAALGGTWDLFRYPGIRSDSDLYTFGFEFKPWTSAKVIADGESILAYLNETVTEFGIDRHIRYGHKVVAASWSSSDAKWRVEVEVGGQRSLFTASWLFCAGGYYRYDEGFTPRFEGVEQFGGQIIHPQKWPKNLDYAGKKVVVIGSGATAVTLVPAMATSAAHVTMVQRTPTYIMPVPSEDKLSNVFRAVLPKKWAHALSRLKGIWFQKFIYWYAKRYPTRLRRLIRKANVKELPAGYPVDEHFKPPYDPWSQRLCAVPDGDLFKVIREGRASIVTDRIERFTEKGLKLVSGRELEADLIVTATGLNLQAMAGIALTVDGEKVVVSERVTFRGMMLSGVPNMAFAIGYTTASWTLKIGLLCEHLCRIIERMDQTSDAICLPEIDPAMPTRPFLDFGAGYVQRAIADLPRQGDKAPWLTSMDYVSDARYFRRAPIEDPQLHFSKAKR